ncbi:MAG: MFS transporter [Planctomycetota bacterium]|nr:MFS transporter [Planctomycetota bacterium]
MPRLLRILAMSSAVGFVAAITWFGIYTLVNAYMVRGLGCSDAEWTSATLWLTGGMVVWQLLAAPMATKLGRVGAMTLALLVGGAAYAVIAVTRSPLVIGMMLGCMGLTQAMISVVFIPLIADVGGDPPGRAIAAYEWLVTAVSVAASGSGGSLIDRGVYAPVFLAIAGLSMASAGLFFMLCRDPALLSKAADSRPAIGLHNVTRADLKLLGWPFLAVLVLGISAEPFYYHMVNQLFPNLARQDYGMGEARIATIVALGRLPSLLSLVLVAHRIDRGNTIAIYGMGIVASGTMAIAMAWAPGAAWGVGLYLAYYLCHGVVWGANCAAANAAVPPRLRELAFTLICLGQAGFAYVAGWLHQQMLERGCSIRAVYTVSGSIALVGGVCLLIYAMASPRKPIVGSATGSD